MFMGQQEAPQSHNPHRVPQVHGAVLAKGLADDLGWRWQGSRGLVLKVQKGDMRDLMAADVRNLRRLSAFVADSLPFSPFPVRVLLL